MTKALSIVLALGGTFTPLFPSGADDHRIQVQTGKLVQILPVGRSASMMKMLRHPDGSIYLNTQSTDSSRCLVRSRDDGKTWTILPIQFSPEVPEGQHTTSFGIGSDGKLWLIHQGNTRSEGGEELRYQDRQIFVASSSDGGESWHSLPFNFGHFSPGGTQDPYTVGQVAWCYPNFIARLEVRAAYLRDINGTTGRLANCPVPGPSTRAVAATFPVCRRTTSVPSRSWLSTV